MFGRITNDSLSPIIRSVAECVWFIGLYAFKKIKMSPTKARSFELSVTEMTIGGPRNTFVCGRKKKKDIKLDRNW